MSRATAPWNCHICTKQTNKWCQFWSKWSANLSASVLSSVCYDQWRLKSIIIGHCGLLSYNTYFRQILSTRPNLRVFIQFFSPLFARQSVTFYNGALSSENVVSYYRHKSMYSRLLLPRAAPRHLSSIVSLYLQQTERQCHSLECCHLSVLHCIIWSALYSFCCNSALSVLRDEYMQICSNIEDRFWLHFKWLIPY